MDIFIAVLGAWAIHCSLVIPVQDDMVQFCAVVAIRVYASDHYYNSTAKKTFASTPRPCPDIECSNDSSLLLEPLYCFFNIIYVLMASSFIYYYNWNTIHYKCILYLLLTTSTYVHCGSIGHTMALEVCYKCPMSYKCHSTFIQVSYKCPTTVLQAPYKCPTHVLQAPYTCPTNVLQMSYKCHVCVIQMF